MGVWGNEEERKVVEREEDIFGEVTFSRKLEIVLFMRGFIKLPIQP